MMHIAFFTEADDHLMDQWGYLLMAFGLQKKSYEIGGSYLRWANHIGSVAELPAEPILLFSSPQAQEPSLQGVISLSSHWHLPNSIYLFGPSHRKLTLHDMAGRVAEQRIKIETGSDTELFSPMAAAIALWDRKTKGYELG